MKLNEELCLSSKWFAANELSVIIGKTCCILFRSKFKFSDCHEGLLMQGNHELSQVHECKYLGVIVDQHLDFGSHIDKNWGKINQRTGLVWRVHGCISTELAKDLYMSLIDPHFQYIARKYMMGVKWVQNEHFKFVKTRHCEQY